MSKYIELASNRIRSWGKVNSLANVIKKFKTKNKDKENSDNIFTLFMENIKQNKLAKFSLYILLFFLFVGIFGKYLAPYDPNERHYGLQGIRRLETPSLAHPFGTTDQGRDIFSQVILGTQTALLVGGIASVLVTFVGSTLGIISGYYGGKVDAVIMRIVDFFYAIPFIPFVIVLSAVMKPSLTNIIFAVSLLSWRTITRLVRSQVLSISQRPFVKAAKVSGASDFRIMYKHILPNVIPIILLELAFNVNTAIMAESSISFLGFGDPVKISWGNILHTSFISGNSRTAWWWTMAPGFALILLLTSVFYVAQSLEEVIDPRLRGK